MKAIILAAGLGSRLKKLTKDKPKCLIEYKNKPLISYQINALLDENIDKIAVVGGYKFEILKKYLNSNFPQVKLFKNNDFATTNMTYSLFCAKDFMNDDLIISYSDIIYDKSFINKLKQNSNDFSVMVDKNWLKLWSIRFKDPLSDAETMKIQNGFIKQLGKKPKNLNEIDAQYMGLFKFSKSFLPLVKNLWEEIDKMALYDGRDYKNIFMTSFLNELITKFDNALAVYASKSWLEVDFQSDLTIDIEKI